MTALLVERTLEAATGRAEAFLLGRQDAGGAWRDFLLPAGLSDAWVTGYVGEALAGSGGAAARAAARRGWAFLVRAASVAGGWGYNAAVPADADSSLWGMRLAAALGEDGSATALRTAAFLDTHVRGDGGLATYADDAAIRAYTGLPPFVSFAGWTQAHVCVSAAGAHLPRHAARLSRYLRGAQDVDGGWTSYFWFDREYATGEAASALATDDASPAAVERAATWLADRIAQMLRDDLPQPFALACAVSGLARVSRCGNDRTLAALAARGGERLAAWQRDDGSWGPDARLRVPPPGALVPPADARWPRWEGPPGDDASPFERIAATFTNHSPDHRGVFTAAAGLRALRAVAAWDA